MPFQSCKANFINDAASDYRQILGVAMQRTCILRILIEYSRALWLKPEYLVLSIR